ncbi:MAG: CHASE2 domain-containing protein [Coleofasciculaceae cyanobacterium]
MGKLVVLRLDGDSQQEGFRVTFAIGAEETLPDIEMTGYLPPAPDLATQLQHHWLEKYRTLGAPYRITTKRIIYDGSFRERIVACQESARTLRDRLAQWLDSQSFRPLERRLLQELNRDDQIRVLIRTDDYQLQKLPWHLWDFFERYPKAELALAPLESESLPPPLPTISKHQVRVLAILGHKEGINTDADQKLLANLPNAEVTFLVEPEHHTINDQLWEQTWDIIFFAGHSETDGETGRIYINPTDSLTINELWYALKKAVEKGLKLAIFNSCDGLGLARQLNDLHIPQLIVMRELVPDYVAQEFLKYFLTAFASGKSLYLAVREARERLQGLESEFPCASWLPVIFQNPALVPPSWQELLRPKLPSTPSHPWRGGWQEVLAGSILVTGLVMGVRLLGGLQPIEIWAFDHMLQLRPQEEIDQRLLVVKLTEQDIQQQAQYPLSDQVLLATLQRLEEHQPRAIGLDIYRDLPSEPGHADLATYIGKSQRLVTTCFVGSSESGQPDQVGVSPPPTSRPENQSFSDFLPDDDGVIRRHLFYLNPERSSPCQTNYALSAELVFRYLEAKGIKPGKTTQGNLKLGDVVFERLEKHTGFYHNIDDRGHQVLLNYHSSYQPFREVTLTDILNNNFDASWVKDRLVLIGVTAPSVKDYFPTPYGKGTEQKMPGVVIHAQMVSQMLSAVERGRPLLQFWPQWLDALWITGWSLVGGFAVGQRQLSLRQKLAFAGVILILFGSSLGLLLWGVCVPFIPSLLALVGSGWLIKSFRPSSTIDN